jgi:tetratricopeptide (TPR) repeat protein
MRLGISVALAVVAFVGLAVAADDLAPVKEQAVRLYDQGKYGEALKTLVDLDTARALDGPLLYRLFFCQKAVGDDDTARKSLERAQVALEDELGAKASLEAAFYLANTYTNLGRASDAKRVSQEATTKLDKGSIAAPKSAIGLFQVGKLYQDQGRQVEATTYYEKALDSFDLTDGRYVGNARWALRFLGNNAFAKPDFAASEKAFARLAEIGGADQADWETLASARVRLGRYQPAAEAWKAVVKMNPGDADDARYAARLADTAAAIAPLPPSAPGGRAFTAMSQTELEAFMKAQSQAALAAQTQVSDPKLLAETATKLLETRKVFVAACLEYAVRRYGIRETAFREGYAVLIFQDRAWELPPAPEPAARAPSGDGS